MPEINLSRIQSDAELAALFAAALFRFGRPETAQAWAEKAEAHWQRWIEAKERQQARTANA